MRQIDLLDLLALVGVGKVLFGLVLLAECCGFMRQIDLLDLLALVGVGSLCFGVKRCWSVARLPGACGQG